MQTIELPAHCDRNAAAALCPDLQEATEVGPVRVNAAKVERMSMAMLQLLLAARSSTHGLHIENASDAMREALSLTGQQSLLAEGEQV